MSEAFHVGDAVVHPVRGAGFITKIEEFERQGNDRTYYKIQLVAQPRTNVRVPVEEAEDHGVRGTVSRGVLRRVWRAMDDEPQGLPSNHNTRGKVLREKLHSGDVVKIAEILRDLAWRRREKGSLGIKDRRLYRQAVTMLAGEIAAVRELDIESAESEVRKRVRKACIEAA